MDSIPTKELHYEPLVGSEIRLLRIKPNNGQGPLECSLVHYELMPDTSNVGTDTDELTEQQRLTELLSQKKKPRYHALSYIWGTSTEKVPILVNGCQLDIGKNLYAALFRIQKLFRSGSYQLVGDRSSDGQGLFLDLANFSRLIWADAICINQEDIEEKSLQVPRMGDIYREAADVIAWFGEPSEEDFPQLERWVKAVPVLCQLDGVRLEKSSAFERLQFLCKIASEQNDDRVKSMAPILRHILPSGLYEAYTSGILEEILIEGDAHDCAKAIAECMDIFMSNEWFSRIWTVQEALLSRGSGLCNILIGELRTNFRAIVAIKEFMEVVSDRVQNRITGRFPSVFSLANLYKWFDVDNYLSEADEVAVARRLNSAIRLTMGRKAANPHDHIYGLLGLLDASKLPDHLQPDYSLSFEQVWHEYIAFVVEKTGDLNRLCCSGRTLNNVPNWVPDLRCTGKTLETPLEDSFVSFSADGNKINVRGVQLGTIIGLFIFETDRVWDFEDSRYWSTETTSYEACVEQLKKFDNDFLCRLKALRNCTDKEVFRSIAHGSWYSEWDIRDQYEDMRDLCEPRPPTADQHESSEEKQRKEHCIALTKKLSDGPVLLTDTGLIVQDRHEDSRAFDYNNGPGGQLPEGEDVLCMLMGSNSPWRLRKTADEYELIGDSCLIIEKRQRPIYNMEYYAEKKIEDFVIS